MKFTKFQLIALYIFAGVLFIFGLYVLLQDVHLVGNHSVWNRALGGLCLFFAITMMFPIQVAYVIKLLRESAGLVWGFRKGEIPPPPDIRPGTPVTDEHKTPDQNELKG